MKKLTTAFFFAIYLLTVMFTGVAFAETNCTGWTYFDPDLDTCVACGDSGFTITTTNLTANTEFWFNISAMGDFVVDWDDNKIEHITRDTTDATEYMHKYTTAGVKNIKFCGRATEYNPANGNNVVAAITFYNGTTSGSHTKIASVSGSMGSVFPTISNGTNPNQQPRFRSTFQGANNLTSIPATLFDGVSGSADGMFRSTFDKCSKLSVIPYGLFANATGGAPNMFRSTFYQCTGLTSLPEDLFAGITVPETDEFMFTFYGTTGLKGKYIPKSTFTGLIINDVNKNTDMWDRTFESSGLITTTCPARTKKFLTGYEGTTAKKTWAGHISCEPVNPCVGTEYWNESANECSQCPGDYTYDTTDTKESINECKIQCQAGTYLANANDLTCSNAGAGHYAVGAVVSYGSTSSRTTCPNNMPTLNDMVNATNESQCVVYCHGTKYRDSSTNTCVPCPTGYEADTTDGKTANTDCKIHCEGGTYLSSAGAAECINVGDGFYSSETTVAFGSTSSREQCSDGRMTGKLNATSAKDCIELCTGATYRDSKTDMCVSCPMGYNAHTISGKTSANQCQIHCVAGTYIMKAKDTICANVGDGYYATASDVNYGSAGTRNQCPEGQLTGTLTATDLSQCKTSCAGATYYDSATGQCQDCPSGYQDNETNGKNSINQCQHFCAAGTYAETYTPVLYLGTTGTHQFIDTKYEITGTHIHGVAVVGTPTKMSGQSSDSGNFFGNLYGPGGFSTNFKQGNFGLWIQSAKKGDKAKYPGDGLGEFNANQQYTITFDVAMGQKSTTAKLRVDDGPEKSVTLENAPINDTGNTFKLFTNGSASRNGDTVAITWGDRLFDGRIYSLQLYEEDKETGQDNLVLDLIPVRRHSDNALGVFDRVNNVFYGNAGTDNFSAADDDNAESFMLCTPVGNGYYVAANYTNFGSYGTRNRCPNGAPTMVGDSVINNAYSIYQCDGVEPCEGPKYPNLETGICTQCPTGYDFNTQNRKESVYECQTHCYEGTYLANAHDATCTNVGNGYYAGEDTINWGDVGIRHRCSNGGPTNKEDAATEDECLAVVNTCTGATYMNLGVCTPCPAGYGANISEGKDKASDCQLICPEGTYLATVHGTTCTDAGVGFWATGGAVNYGSTSSPIACASGLTTVGYGHGADELADCGRKLHIGNYILYTKTTKPTTPAINIRPDNGPTHYIGVSPTNHALTPVHISTSNQQYTAFDDGILYGERDFNTNTRITQ